MQKFLLIMHRKLVSDGIKNSLEKDSDIAVYVEHIYENAVFAADIRNPDIVMLEIPETDADNPNYYLKICDKIKKTIPACKLLLMCHENSAESKRAVIEAMRLKKIDDFVFFDITLDYLRSKLAVLVPNLNDRQ